MHLANHIFISICDFTWPHVYICMKGNTHVLQNYNEIVINNKGEHTKTSNRQCLFLLHTLTTFLAKQEMGDTQ